MRLSTRPPQQAGKNRIGAARRPPTSPDPGLPTKRALLLAITLFLRQSELGATGSAIPDGIGMPRQGRGSELLSAVVPREHLPAMPASIRAQLGQAPERRQYPNERRRLPASGARRRRRSIFRYGFHAVSTGTLRRQALICVNGRCAQRCARAATPAVARPRPGEGHGFAPSRWIFW